MKPACACLFLLLNVVALFMNDVPAFAKAAYASKNQMIDCSEVIAVVDIKNVEKSAEKGKSWVFGQKATARTVQLLKGKLPGTCTIYGGENFICARCDLTVGKSLVFLNRDEERLIGSNWHLSIRPIKNEQLDWLESDSINLKPANLSIVIGEIKKELGDDPQLERLKGSLKELSQAQALTDSGSTEAKSPSTYRKAVRGLKPAQKPLLWSMFKNATPAGRIYAAMLLRHIDKTEGDRALAMLATCNGTVKYKSGSKQTSVGVWQVCSELFSKSKYMNLEL